MNLKIIYEDGSVLVLDKPAGVVVFPEGNSRGKTLIDYLVDENPELKSVGEGPRYGVVHRLDKDTSGILLVAKKAEALIFLQKQFKNREVEKKYTTLVVGSIKEDGGNIETLIGRSPSDPRKQKAYNLGEKAPQSARDAITEYKVLERFQEYTLIEVKIKTGRKHQIRCHMTYIHHPVAGDSMYSFKDSPVPVGLNRQFLHSHYLKIKLPNGNVKEFNSELPEDLKQILEDIK
mgnify:CR=1 FL=1